MFTNPPSSSVVCERLSKFLPPYCPNPKCKFHNPSNQKGAIYYSHGGNKVQRFPYEVLRFRCKACRRTFSSSFFSLSYRDKCNDIYERIDTLRRHGSSKRGVAHTLKCSEDTVRNKIKKMARWSLLRMAKDMQHIQIKESVAYDGLENFSYSQFEPNNLNHVVGKESYFIYDFNFSPMNRKGKMSNQQKVKKKLLENKHGRYPTRAIENDSKKIFVRLLSRSKGEIHLHSDNHFAYRRAIRKIENSHRICHSITPAKVYRNFRNRLFPINHTDLLTRHHLADFKRETIAFAKSTIAMMESFIVFAAYKNYRRSRFTKFHRRDPRAHLESPAMKLGLEKKILSFKEFFSERICSTHVDLNQDWRLFFQSIDPYSRRPIKMFGVFRAIRHGSGLTGFHSYPRTIKFIT